MVDLMVLTMFSLINSARKQIYWGFPAPLSSLVIYWEHRGLILCDNCFTTLHDFLQHKDGKQNQQKDKICGVKLGGNQVQFLPVQSQKPHLILQEIVTVFLCDNETGKLVSGCLQGLVTITEIKYPMTGMYIHSSRLWDWKQVPSITFVCTCRSGIVSLS